jgi:hypothetical protein
VGGWVGGDSSSRVVRRMVRDRLIGLRTGLSVAEMQVKGHVTM